MFDPYSAFLNIPPGQRPPTHYQLLDIDPSELNPNTIREAGERRIEQLSPYLNSVNGVHAHRVRKEVQEALRTLLDPVRRQAYDATLAIPVTPWWKDPQPEDELHIVEESVAVSVGSTPTTANLPYDLFEERKPIPATTVTTTHSSTPTSKQVLVPIVIKQSAKPKDRSFLLLSFVGLLLVGGVVTLLILFRTGGLTPTESTKEEIVENTNPITPPTTPENKQEKKEEPLEPLEKTPAKKLEFHDPVTFEGGHKQPIVQISIRRDGLELLTTSQDRFVDTWRVADWNVATEMSRRRHQFDSAGLACFYLAEGRECLIADQGVVRLFDLVRNVVRKEYKSPVGGISSVAILPDNLNVLIGGKDGTLRHWNMSDNRTFESNIKNNIALMAIAVSVDGTLAAIAAFDGTITTWDVKENKTLQTWKAHEKEITSLQFDRAGKRLLSSSADQTAGVWDMSGGAEIQRLRGHSSILSAASWCFEDQRIVTGSYDRTIRLWDVTSGRETSWRGGTEEKITTITVDPKNRYVLAGTVIGTIQLLPLPRVRPDDGSRLAGKPPAEKFPEPSMEEQQAATKKVRETYVADLERTSVAEKRMLAEKLLRRATTANEEPAFRFALFQESAKLLVSTLDALEAFKVVDAMVPWFAIDELTEKADLLEKISQFGTNTIQRSLVEIALVYVDRAEKEARPELVERFFKMAKDAARFSSVQELINRVDRVEARIKETELYKAEVLAAQNKLKSQPNDPQASAIVGRHLCFKQNDWEQGITLLIQSNDPTLSELAKKDRSNPKDLKTQLELGNGWYEVGISQKDEMKKRHVWIHAKNWFDKAQDNNISGFDKVQASSRTREIVKFLEGGKETTPTPTPATPQSKGIERNAFNTIKPEATMKNQWLIDGKYRMESGGVRWEAGDVAISSKFRFMDSWKVTMTFIPDGRSVEIVACDETIVIEPQPGRESVTLVVKREGAKLGYSLTSPNNKPEQRTIFLAENKQKPTTFTLRFTGKNSRKEGVLLSNLFITGLIKPLE